MNEDTKWKEFLTNVLVKLGFLRENTEQIVININNGKVCDIKKTDRHK